ncbi:MAG: TonB-dependent receptor, partial [Acidobacteria bacterium]|nr:TonB-dependent receptor [Acidobacteriota bacterium]
MFNDRNRISFRYGQTPWLNYSKLSWGTNAAEPSGEYPSTRIPRTWGADWTYTVSPAIVANLRFGLSRDEGQGGNTLGVGYDPKQLGFPASLVGQFTALMFPRFNVGNYSPLGASPVFSYSTNDAYSLQPNISWTRGKHFLKIGTEFRRYNDNSQGPGLASGAYTFSTGFTGADPQRSDAVSGNEFASFLLGYPSAGQVDRNIYPAYRNKYYAAYIQDDFKVTPKLTLNLGLRWDYETPRYERFNRMVTDFTFGGASPIAAASKSSANAANCPACAAGLTGGIVYAGASGDARYVFAPKKAQFQPRIGVAYRATSKMVVRGGWAISYLGQSSVGQSYGYSRSTSLTPSLDNGLTPAVTLSDPFPSS